MNSQRPSIRVTRSSSGDGLPTQWELLKFSIAPPDAPPGVTAPPVATTYLFRRGLQYHWTFTATLADLEGGVQGTPFPGKSTQPVVFAYAGKDATALTASVLVEWKGAPGGSKSFTVPAQKQDVIPSPEMRAHRAFETTEIASWVLAGVLAMISGLWLLYAKNPTFGQFQDYLGLFAWGVGIDQGKNLLGVLQSWNTSTKT
jgi:hypothetical protein